MKKTTVLLIFLLFIATQSCTSEDKQGPQLPPETQIGANTFGVTIKQKVYIPRDPTGFDFGPQGKGMLFYGDYTDNEQLYNELIVLDGASSVGFKMIIHIQSIYNLGARIYTLHQSTFRNGIDSPSYTHIFFYIWDDKIKGYTYYGSIENKGKLNITYYDFSSRRVSGNFSGKFQRYNNPSDIIEITDGRFDIKWDDLNTHPFP